MQRLRHGNLVEQQRDIREVQRNMSLIRSPAAGLKDRMQEEEEHEQMQEEREQNQSLRIEGQKQMQEEEEEKMYTDIDAEPEELLEAN